MVAITLKEKRANAILPTPPSYDVLFFGEIVDELYYNVNNYSGTLPCPPEPGQKTRKEVMGRPFLSLDIGNGPLNHFKREIVKLNREWAEWERHIKNFKR